MERNEEQIPVEVVDLGTPSSDTHGSDGFMPELTGLYHKAGISDD